MKTEISKKAIPYMALNIQLEEAALTAIAIYFLSKYNLGLPVWAWVLLFFSPDISMVGYFINTRIGAYLYNLAHHRAIALIIISAGLYVVNPITIALGTLLFAHSSFDRMMGYGLKYTDNFQHTHLGQIGQKKQTPKTT